MEKMYKRKMIRFDWALWEELQERAKAEERRNMEQFIRYICRQYLKTDGFSNTYNIAKNQEEQKRRREQILNEEYQFVSKLNSLLKTVKNEAKPPGYDEKVKQVVDLISHSPKKFGEIADQTNISKEELIVIIGNLVDSGTIGFDQRWRYFKN
ncbi:hypothetical protein [Candidatus Harpocratesius sp.]